MLNIQDLLNLIKSNGTIQAKSIEIDGDNAIIEIESVKAKISSKALYKNKQLQAGLLIPEL